MFQANSLLFEFAKPNKLEMAGPRKKNLAVIFIQTLPDSQNMFWQNRLDQFLSVFHFFFTKH